MSVYLVVFDTLRYKPFKEGWQLRIEEMARISSKIPSGKFFGEAEHFFIIETDMGIDDIAELAYDRVGEADKFVVIDITKGYGLTVGDMEVSGFHEDFPMIEEYRKKRRRKQ